MRSLIAILVAAVVLFPLTVYSAQTPYSVQPHIHGSFSEGPGSISSQTYVALDANLDVIWWSDHDWRMTYYHHVSSFSFEDWSEPLYNNEPWTPNRPSEATGTKSWELNCNDGFYLHEASITGARAYEGLPILRIEGISGETDFQRLYYDFTSGRMRHIRSLASNVSVDLAIFPESVGPDARAAVLINLSRHPPNEFLPLKQYILHYFLDNDISEPYREDQIYHIPVAYVENEWNVYSLPVTQDAIQGFPFIDGEDNSLHEVLLGVESRRDGHAVAYFDAFLINHDIEGNELFAKQRSMLDAMEQLFPEVKQLQGTELSYDRHLNEYSVGTVLYDYDELAELSGYTDENGWITDVKAYRAFVAQYMIAQAHARGGVVSYVHPFGTSEAGAPPTHTKEEVRDHLLANRLYGADILEVGYRHRGGHDIKDHLWVWDELAKHGLYVVGNGSSDNHGGAENNWRNTTNNFVSWIYARSPDRFPLIKGMKRGLVFFGDIGQFDGELELSTPNGFHMGQIVITDKPEEDVSIYIEDLASGDTVKIIEYGVNTRTYVAEGSTFERTETIPIDATNGTFLRIEVYNAEGREKVFSNPIYFIRQVPAEGISPFKAAIDLGGIFSTSIKSFTITDAYFHLQPGWRTLTMKGFADGGRIVLDCTALGAPDEVRFVHMTGSWSYEGGLLTLSGLVSEADCGDPKAPGISVYFPDGVSRHMQKEGLKKELIPTEYSLSQSYPNPFNANTIINYQLPVDSYVKLEVYNLLGEKVAKLVDEKQEGGYKSAIWDASEMSSGLYFYKLTAGVFTETKRMLLVK